MKPSYLEGTTYKVGCSAVASTLVPGVREPAPDFIGRSEEAHEPGIRKKVGKVVASAKEVAGLAPVFDRVAA